MIKILKFLEKTLIYLVYLIPAILIFIFIRLLSPIKIIKFGMISSHRIGHFTIEWEIFSRLNLAQKLNVYFISFQKNISNSFFEKLIRDKKLIFPPQLIKLLQILNKTLFGNHKHEFNFNDLTYKYSKFKKKIDNAKPTLKISNIELKKKENFLRFLGSKKIICIMSRDGKYLAKNFIKKNDYNNLRNSNINDFIPAIKSLEKRGYLIIRMGKMVLNKLKYKSNNVIDYANSPLRSDFLDIYLIKKSTLVVSTGFGIDSVAMIFNKPMVYVNYFPIGECSVFSKNVIFSYKKYFSSKKKSYLTLTDLFKSRIAYDDCNLSKFKKKKIYIKNMSPDEIKDVVLEADENLKKKVKHKENQILFEKKYNSLISKFPSNDDYKGKLCPKVSEIYLSKNKFLLS